MNESLSVPDDLVCPACHFGCKLVKYQCGRGREFFELAAAGEEIPERRGPMMTPSERAALGGDGRPPLNNRVMHGLNILSNRLQDRHAEAGERKLVLTLARVGSFMSVSFLPKRMLMSVEESEEAFATAREHGFAEEVADERVGWVIRLTEAGKQQASVWSAERDARTAEFLSPLSDEEKETLESLVRKLIHVR